MVQNLKTHSVDKPLLYTVFILFVGGLLILASASMVLSQKKFGNMGYYTIRQLVAGLIGLAALWVISKINYRFWRRVSLPLMIFSLLLLAAVFLPKVGFAFGGARRWIDLGILTFQPAEILKITFIIYLASWLDARRQDISKISYGLVPFSMMLAIVGVFLIMQPDFGTLGIIVLTSGLLYVLGGGKRSQVTTLIILGLALSMLIIQLAPYRMNRVRTFLDPEKDPQGKSYHVNQALIAIGSGGFLGSGFGKGLQKYNYLPEPMGDSIFAVYAEETGFLGVSLLISTFGFLLWRGMLIAKKAPDVFGRLLAGGIVLWIALQVFINMAAISGLLPLTGIPLPLVSYGGTSLVITLARLGMVLNVSRYT